MRGLPYRRRGLLVLTAAAAVGSVLPAWAADDQAVIAPIQRLNDGLLQIMKAGPQTPFQQRFDMLGPVIDQTFDLPHILQASVGLTWANMPQDQKTMLEKAFRRYTIASYVNSFDSFNGQRFEIAPQTRAVGNGQQVVRTKIIPRSGGGHQLDYVMHQVNGAWRVMDVLADGSISRVAVQRSDFRYLLTRGGPQALAESLRTKSADLSEGAG
ncbi:MAG TPA: ABC transporter substrate-binding protein [Rhodopila sp.]|nr:ABC transporter substrate-binding protein [Rhodopila sp.]